MRRHHAATTVDLITLAIIGAVSALVMVASAGPLQWLSGAVALVSPVLARGVLRRDGDPGAWTVAESQPLVTASCLIEEERPWASTQRHCRAV